MAVSGEVTGAAGATGVVYRRILLKLSGEALLGAGRFGIEPESLQTVARGVGELRALGVEVALVIGAGNIFRGAELVKGGMERVTADHIGMLATVVNALAFTGRSRAQWTRREGDVRDSNQRALRTVSAPPCDAAPGEGQGGDLRGRTGNPFFTTDTAASLRAVEIEADLMIKATKVDGVYSADPMSDSTARRFSRLGFDQVLRMKLSVMDATAIVMCRDNDMSLRVIDMNKSGVLVRSVMGEDEGTLVENVPDDGGSGV